MPRPAQQAQIRQARLTEMLVEAGQVHIGTAATELGVTSMTIRRDLSGLAAKGQVLRCYGGAVSSQRISFEFAFDQRQRRHRDAKQHIGVAAAAAVKPGWTVMLDTGTTTLEVARALLQRRAVCRVCTTSLVIASELWASDHIELILIGGRVRQGVPDMIGPATETMIAGMGADIAFIGTDGIDPQRGAFAAYHEVARVAECMAGAARRVVVVADGSKLGTGRSFRVLPIGSMRELITSRDAGPAMIRQLQRRGVKVTRA